MMHIIKRWPDVDRAARGPCDGLFWEAARVTTALLCIAWLCNGQVTRERRVATAMGLREGAHVRQVAGVAHPVDTNTAQPERPGR